MKYVIYTGENEIIVTTPKNEARTIVEAFDEGGRKKKDYDRRILQDSAVFISSEVKTLW